VDLRKTITSLGKPDFDRYDKMSCLVKKVNDAGSAIVALETGEEINIPTIFLKPPARSEQDLVWEGERRSGYIPTDACVMSPDVQLFRNSAKGYCFESTPSTITGVCSVAMFNRNPRVQDTPLDSPKHFDRYLHQVKRKFQAVVCAAEQLKAQVLVCPDIGCGINANDPVAMGAMFGEALREFASGIEEVTVTGIPSFFEAAKSALTGKQVKIKPAASEAAATAAAVAFEKDAHLAAMGMKLRD